VVGLLAAREPESGLGPRLLAVIGAKGGVGRSTLALNLAVAAGAEGPVLLLDANLPGGDLATLLGATPPAPLLEGHVDTVTVAPGVDLAQLCAADGVLELPPPARLAELEAGYRWIVADTGTGLAAPDLSAALAADWALLVVAPELPAVADGYATVKALHRHGLGIPVACVVNMADSAEEAADIQTGLAQLASSFLGAQIDNWGYIPFHRDVRVAARGQTPFVQTAPSSPAATAVAHLLTEFSEKRTVRPPEDGARLAGILRHFGGPSRRATQQEVRAIP
jgi:flagellar biosynthesis protein FlhG